MFNSCQFLVQIECIRICHSSDKIGDQLKTSIQIKGIQLIGKFFLGDYFFTGGSSVLGDRLFLTMKGNEYKIMRNKLE